MRERETKKARRGSCRSSRSFRALSAANAACPENTAASRVPQERILLAETRETKRQVTDKISHIQEVGKSGEDLFDQLLENLEGLSERLTEICNELQSAAQEKIDLSKVKLNELRTEVRAMLAEINSPSALIAT